MKRYFILLLFLFVNCSSDVETVRFEELSGEWLKIRDEESFGIATFERYKDEDIVAIHLNHYDGSAGGVYTLENKNIYLLGTDIYNEKFSKCKVYKIGPNLIKIERKDFTHYFIRKSYVLTSWG